MIFRYDNQTDMLYISLSNGVSVDSQEVADGIVLDFDGDNRVIGVEIEDAGKRIDLANLELNAMPVSNLIFSERVSPSV